MADDPCCNSFGGRISIEVDGDRWPPTEGDIMLDPTNIEVEAFANQDGSAAYQSKPKLYGAELKFRHPCGVKWDEAIRKCAINVTIVEEDNGRTHLFTGCRIVGKPSLNLGTGEVDGLRVAGPRYQRIND